MTETLLERLKNGQALQRLADDLAISDKFDSQIVILWRKGFDTLAIARDYMRPPVHESVVANRLAALRDGGAL